MDGLPETLRRRLAESLPGVEAQFRMAPRPRLGPEMAESQAPLRPAAALLLLYPRDHAWYLPLTVRGAGLRHHTSQVSLPGGRVDEGESLEATALREAHEEIGVDPASVELLGRLTPIPVWVSHHLLHPVVGLAAGRPLFRVATPEVDRLIELSLTAIRRPDAVSWERRQRSRPPYGPMDVPYFAVDGERVWGATAMVLSEFLALLED